MEVACRVGRDARAGDGVIGWRRRRAIKAARGAFDRCYGVPYETELSALERRGMALLERAGEALRDSVADGTAFTGTHWHRDPFVRAR